MQVPYEAVRTFRGDPGAVSEARAFVREVLDECDLAPFGDVVVLLSAELVTNAVCHADSGVVLRARCTRSRFRVEVEDASTEPPVLAHPRPLDEHGRGLFIVDELASAWGTEARREGKTVWFEIDVARGQPEPGARSVGASRTTSEPSTSSRKPR